MTPGYGEGAGLGLHVPDGAPRALPAHHQPEPDSFIFSRNSFSNSDSFFADVQQAQHCSAAAFPYILASMAYLADRSHTGNFFSVTC